MRSPKTFTKELLTGRFPFNMLLRFVRSRPVAFGKRANTSLLFDRRFQQDDNVLVIQYEAEAAHLAACEPRGDFSFECDWSFSGHVP